MQPSTSRTVRTGWIGPVVICTVLALTLAVAGGAAAGAPPLDLDGGPGDGSDEGDSPDGSGAGQDTATTGIGGGDYLSVTPPSIWEGELCPGPTVRPSCDRPPGDGDDVAPRDRFESFTGPGPGANAPIGSTGVRSDVDDPGPRTQTESDSGPDEVPVPTGGLPSPDGPVLTVVAVGIPSGWAAWVLYRRLRREELLDNEIRSALVDLARDHPGIHAKEAARRLDVADTTVLYHARVLSEQGLLVVRTDHRETTFFAPGDLATRLERQVAATLQQPAKRELMELLADEPVHLSEAARRLDKHRSTVKRQADALLGRGLLTERPSTPGEGRVVELAPGVEDALDAIR